MAVAHTLTFVALGTALRRGELLALRWRDVPFLEHRLHVREAYVDSRFTTPKSRASRRTIELGPQTIRQLETHWRQSACRGDDELVFSHPQLGTPLDPSKLAKAYMRPALKHAGISKPFRPFHDLRHTALTHEAAAGNPHAYIHAAQVLFPGAAARGEERIFAAVAGNPQRSGPVSPAGLQSAESHAAESEPAHRSRGAPANLISAMTTRT